jgi:hypothetical protein
MVKTTVPAVARGRRLPPDSARYGEMIVRSEK